MKAFRLAGVLLFCLSIGGVGDFTRVPRRGRRGGGKPDSAGAALPRVPEGRHVARQLRRAGARRRSRRVFDADVGVDGQPAAASRRYRVRSRRLGCGRQRYAASARATHYSRRARRPTTRCSPHDVAQALNDVATTTDPSNGLASSSARARRSPTGRRRTTTTSSRSPADAGHARRGDRRSARGRRRTTLRSESVAIADAPPPSSRCCRRRPAGDHRADAVGRPLTDSPAERTSLLAVAVAAIDRDAAFLPAGLGRGGTGVGHARRLPASSRSIACIDVWRPRCFASRTSARTRGRRARRPAAVRPGAKRATKRLAATVRTQ